MFQVSITSELLSENKTLTKFKWHNFHNKRNRVIILALCSTLHINMYLSMFQVSINSIQNIWVFVRKQSFNLIVDAARPPANLLAEIFRWKIRLKVLWRQKISTTCMKARKHCFWCIDWGTYKTFFKRRRFLTCINKLWLTII